MQTVNEAVVDHTGHKRRVVVAHLHARDRLLLLPIDFLLIERRLLPRSSDARAITESILSLITPALT